jgi:hypothetical protein
VNVEAFVEMEGPARKVGVAALLSETGDGVQFRSLLEEFVVENSDPAEQTPEEAEDARLDEIRRIIGRADASLTAKEAAVGWHLTLDIAVRDLPLVRGDRVSARLVTRSQWVSTSSRGALSAELVANRPSEITSLVALRLRGDLNRSVDFVIFATLHGGPEDRLDRVLLDLVPTSRQFALLMFLLLSAGDEDAQSDGRVRHRLMLSGTGDDDDEGDLDFPLFESLVRATARDPERLVVVDRMIEAFARTEEGRDRLPEGLEELWSAFRPIVAKAAK